MTDTFLDGWAEWWSTVPPEFAFLLALPFVIAILVFVAERVRAARSGRPQAGRTSQGGRPSGRAARLHH